MKRIFIDYETALLSGKASVEFYRHDFRVTSCAFSWRNDEGEIESHYVEGEEGVYEALKRLDPEIWEAWAHNLQFEYAVTRCRFPDVSLNWSGDTMRLVQVYDHGGSIFDDPGEESLTLDQELEELATEAEVEDPKAKVYNLGMGLDRSVKRILPKHLHGHKDRAYAWIKKNVPEASKSNAKLGSFLHHLPSALMRDYNIGDTEATLHLYEFITDYFNRIGYDWRYDHALYIGSVFDTAEAEIRGISVDRTRLRMETGAFRDKIQRIAVEFRKEFEREIRAIERTRFIKQIFKQGKRKDKEGNSIVTKPKWKTIKSRYRRLKKESVEVVPLDRKKNNWWHMHVGFNVGSNQQLAALFCDQLGMVPEFFTEKGAPSFKSSLLHQWGDGGKILAKRRKLVIVYKQMLNLYYLSEYDGKWHWGFKTVGTATGRMAGGRHA